MHELSTQTVDYAQRLVRLQSAGLRRWIDVQAPYRAHLRNLKLGFTLDLGAGVGRNLLHLKGEGVGVDHNPEAVRQMRERGLVAYTSEEFMQSPYARAERFDSILFAHVAEHLEWDNAIGLLAEYLKFLKPGGKLVVITPQEAGFRSDPTHVNFLDDKACIELVTKLGLKVIQSYSFPLPRFTGRFFPHNEFVTLAQK